MTSSEKTKFRTTKQWTEFRKEFIKLKNYTCELCGTKFTEKSSRSLQVHHHKVNDYTNLNSIDDFSCLCSSCHKTVEKIATKLYAKNKNLLNEDLWLNLLGKHIPDKPIKEKKK